MPNSGYFSTMRPIYFVFNILASPDTPLSTLAVTEWGCSLYPLPPSLRAGVFAKKWRTFAG